jgi:cathepsin B
MKTAVLAFAAAVVSAQNLDLSKPALNPDTIHAVNTNAGAKWTAGLNDKFRNLTLAEAKQFMGVKRNVPEVAAAKARLSAWKGPAKAVSALPSAFDVRVQWPQCANISGHIRDQSDCGSCWAFGTTEAFNDRLCITHGFSTLLSPTDTFACCDFNNGCLGSSGCDGGIPEEAWTYFQQHGVVTGGDYGDSLTATCSNYVFPQCSHHEAGKYPMCPTNEYNTPACPNACTNTGYAGSWSKDKHFATSGYNLNSVSAAMTDISTYGSITAAFDVYEDFLTYKSGIYHHVSGQLLGGHAVKIIGWGVDSGTDYWIVANSWNQYWGNNGTFYIVKGTDECGIEDDLSAGNV